LAGQWAAPEETLTNASVALRFDTWCQQLARLASTEPLSANEQDCLTHFLKVTADLRLHLIQCYDVKDFRRTNNDMERYIRSLKTRYRRISGRKNWNAYLLRYGSCIAYYDWPTGCVYDLPTSWLFQTFDEKLDKRAGDRLEYEHSVNFVLNEPA
jgi:hypothetical protein